jgi:CheY-like chemotaxis protein
MMVADVQPPASRHDASKRLVGIHVLVVDDVADVRTLYQDLLEFEGASVRVAGSARDAIAAFRSDVPDVLVSDIMMPNEDGYWLIKAIRAVPTQGRARPQTLAITGDPHQHSHERVCAAGYDAHLSKPIQWETLCSVVARLAGRL